MNAQRSETEFVDGLRVYAPNERAPDYIIANVAIDRDRLMAWLEDRVPQVRVVIKRSQGGKYYAAVDTYQRDSEPRQPSRVPVPNTDRNKPDEFIDDEIPF